MELGISKEMIARYVMFFHPSLRCFEQKYEHMIFKETNNLPPYFLYICPLCTENYMIFLEEGYSYSSEFSMDHFPPKNAGGQLKALVCKDCNNNAGGQFDFVTKDFLHEVGFNKKVPFSILKAKSKISDISGNYSSFLSVKDDGQIEISLKPDKKIKISMLDDWLKQSVKRSDWQIEMTVPKTDNNKRAKAFLKIAYLACFNQWGYEFVYSDTGEKIRKVLADQLQYPFNNIPVFLFDQPDQLKIVPLGVCFIQRPVEWQTFIVNVPMKLKENNYECIASVLIPTSDGWENLSALNELFTNDKGNKEVEFLPLVPSMLQKQYNGYSTDSKELFQQ
jgi:hypothetical protein